MKLHFEPNLDYQHTAIEAVCDLFRGQEICRSEFNRQPLTLVRVRIKPEFERLESGNHAEYDKEHLLTLQ